MMKMQKVKVGNQEIIEVLAHDSTYVNLNYCLSYFGLLKEGFEPIKDNEIEVRNGKIDSSATMEKYLRRHINTHFDLYGNKLFLVAISQGLVNLVHELWQRMNDEEKWLSILQDDGYSAFAIAVTQSLAIVQLIWQAVPSNEHAKMLQGKGGKYEPFASAIRTKQLDIVRFLSGNMPSECFEKIQESQIYFDAFCGAIGSADLELAEFIWEQVGEEKKVKLLTDHNFLSCLRVYPEKKRLESLNFLWSKATASMQQKIIKDFGFSLIFEACRLSCLEAIKFFWNHFDSEQRSSAILRNNYGLISLAAGGNNNTNEINLDIFEFFWSSLPEQKKIEVILDNNEYNLFLVVVERNEIVIAKMLWEMLNDEQKRLYLTNELTRAPQYNIFFVAVRNEALEMFILLYNELKRLIPADDQVKFFEFINPALFQKILTSLNEDKGFFKFIWGNLDNDKKTATLERVSFAFETACSDGKLDIVRVVFEDINDETKNAILSRDNYQIFRGTAGSYMAKNEAVLRFLWEQMSAETKKAALEAENYRAFSSSVKMRNISNSKFLLEVATEEQKAAMLKIAPFDPNAPLDEPVSSAFSNFGSSQFGIVQPTNFQFSTPIVNSSQSGSSQPSGFGFGSSQFGSSQPSSFGLGSSLFGSSQPSGFGLLGSAQSSSFGLSSFQSGSFQSDTSESDSSQLKTMKK